MPNSRDEFFYVICDIRTYALAVGLVVYVHFSDHCTSTTKKEPKMSDLMMEIDFVKKANNELHNNEFIDNLLPFPPFFAFISA